MTDFKNVTEASTAHLRENAGTVVQSGEELDVDGDDGLSLPVSAR